MGAVLADRRFVQWNYVDLNSGNSEPEATWSQIEYPFWDMWIGNKPLPYLPGQFFFKAVGPIIAIGNEDAATAPIIPTEMDQYMLGGYGGIRTKGKDVLGTEGQITYFTRTAGQNTNWLADASFTGGGIGGPVTTQGGPGGGPGGPGAGGVATGTQKIWPWTRSQDSDTDKEGSPYSPANIGDSNEQLQYGNPNGVRDGLVLIVTAGEDYIGDR
jgi:hypothetical protein